MYATKPLLLVVSMCLLAPSGVSGQICPPDTPPFEMGMAFTYQGMLIHTNPSGNTSPVDDTCDFEFSLWDCMEGGNMIGGPLDFSGASAIDVIGGQFTAQLDFGDLYHGDARFLEVTVTCPEPFGGPETLAPRIELTPAPHALYTTEAPWSGLVDVPADFADGADDDTLAGLSCADGQIAKWNNGTSQWECAADDTGGGGDFWSLTGNAGTTAGTNFLGTTDNQALELHVNSSRVLRFEPHATSPNVIGGHSGNAASVGVYGATIGGGTQNIAAGFEATVAGGKENTASGNHATVSGGENNTASGLMASTVSGGRDNTASGGDASTVGGGGNNTASAFLSTVGGGIHNIASGMWATVAGGSYNTASGLGSAVPGGDGNTAGGRYSFGAGRRSKANHDGTFVWADSTDADFASSGNNQFLIRASGGVGIGTTSPSEVLDVNGNIHASGTITSGSSIIIDGTAGSEKITSTADLELHVSSGRALRIETNATSPNLIGGYSGNEASVGVYGATIGGGGDSGAENRVANNYGTISGGGNHNASGQYATVGGGLSNTASGTSTIVGGGTQNIASGYDATVAGGKLNTASGNKSTVGGGYENTASSDYYTTVSGGWNNTASDDGATVGGGDWNIASGHESTIAGGGSNNATAFRCTVGGGSGNTASGEYSTVPGGGTNAATGDHSFAAGRRAKANHMGAFIWADSTDADFASTGNDQFLIRAAGGVGINKNNPAPGTLDVAGNIKASGTITSGSSITIDGTTDTITASGGKISFDDEDLVTTGDVGIGIASPAARFQVQDGAVLFDGTTGATPVSGAGTRMMWIPGKKAFRAGWIESDRWDDANIGEGSVALGGKSIASGFCSLALGFANYSTGGYVSTAIGQGNRATGWYSTAIGFGTEANGWGSGARGNYMKVDGTGSYGIGLGNNPTGWTISQSSTMAIMGGNVGIGTISPSYPLEMGSGARCTVGGVWTDASDRDHKDGFASVDVREVLERVTTLPVSTWHFKVEDPSVRHMGVVAQDFYAAFGLGHDDRHIAALDTGGVALAAVQGLHEVVEEKDARIAELETRLAALEKLMKLAITGQEGGVR